MKHLSIIAIAIFTSQYSTAQTTYLQTPCATSAQGKAGNFIVSYTIGEMILVETKQNSNLIITQGILQIDHGLESEDKNGMFDDGDIKVYPNPTPNLLIVKMGMLNQGKMDLQLYDMLGRLIITDQFDYIAFASKQYQLNKYAAGTYLVKLFFTSNNNIIKKGMWKVVKY